MMKNNGSSSREQGFVLFISAMFLIVITLVVIFAVRASTMHEHLSGNMRNHSQSFQAAEYALVQAQLLLTGDVTVPASGCSKGVCAAATALTTLNTPSGWTTLTGTCQVTDTACNVGTNNMYGSTVGVHGTTVIGSIPGLGTLSSQPRFALQPVTSIPSSSCSYYRIMAIGYGGNSNSASVITSLVKACS